MLYDTKGFYNRKNVKRQYLEIGMSMEPYDMSDVDHIVQSVMKISNTFIGSKVKEWMFVVEFLYVEAGQDQNNEKLNQQKQEALRNIKHLLPSTVELNQLISCTIEALVIASKGCSMQRHERWWRDEEPERE